MKYITGNSIIFIIMILLGINSIPSAQMNIAPPESIARYLIKLASLENHLNSKGDLSIYVLGAPEVGEELKKRKGEEIGKSVLRSISISDELPTFKVSMLYIGDPAKLEAAIKYTRENSILSITGLPDLVVKGVTLGLGLDDGKKPKALLNLKASKEENLDWNPAIMKIAQTIE